MYRNPGLTQNGLKQRNTYAVISILGFYTLGDGDGGDPYNNLNMQENKPNMKVFYHFLEIDS